MVSSVLSIVCAPQPVGGVAPLAPDVAHLPLGLLAHRTGLPLPDCGTDWRAGTLLAPAPDGAPCLKVVGRTLLPSPKPGDPARTGGAAVYGWPCPLLETLAPLPASACPMRAYLPGSGPESGPDAANATAGGRRWSLAWITLSDKGAAGRRKDESGPLLASLVRARLPLHHEQGFMLPDDPHALRALVAELALGQGYDLILTSGGTGLAPRDTTPEALLPLFDRRLPGFEQAMMAASLAKTPLAALSRAVAGTLRRTIVITLPGSLRAVAENLEAVLPALGHALEKLHGDPSDCGRSMRPSKARPGSRMPRIQDF